MNLSHEFEDQKLAPGVRKVSDVVDKNNLKRDFLFLL
jgi:hypothetical protein